MSHPQGPTRQPSLDETAKYATTLHYSAIAILVLAPAIALLPPRKLNATTLALTGMTGYSANYLYRERYGQNIWHRAPNPANERAAEFQRQYKLQQAAKLKADNVSAEEAERAKQNLLDKAWMGSETEGWQERRDKEHQKKLSEGKSYADIITEQVRFPISPTTLRCANIL